MIAVVYLASILSSLILLLCFAHAYKYEKTNLIACSLIGFLVVNILICFWEFCLYYNYDFIRSVFLQRVKDSKPLGPLVIFCELPLNRLFSPRFWSYIWIDYTRYDTSYADNQTAGYNIDVINGHSTLLPSLFWLWSIISPLFDPVTTGIVGLLLFYQTFYGSILYGFSYINLKRYKGTSMYDIITKVLLANGVWVLFPIIGMLVSCKLIIENSFRIIQ